MPFLSETQTVMVESAICNEERFWTEAFKVGLGKFDVTTALAKADAALQLHRFMWTKEKEGMHISFAASKVGHEEHWNTGGFGAENADALLFRRVSAREVWSAAFAREWAESSSLVSAATQAGGALDGYAKKTGVDVSSLYADGNAASKAKWRSVWDLMNH
ncbi:hypothetical protein QEG52_001357 [Stenotrophomonas maltophilia]|uniref:hypothetical protein n=1 Tax=Stenotrophomonas sp. Sm3119 TaxID=3002744 RepID=UPI0012B38511|nr:hypothetical protein [Stenotrophomonas sp. Sm3119]EKV1265440.1 hypothetical protein [Stenotrophomonas maltophilia]MDQ7305484.1 hypothetical protein [Stenotrophomonas sp. Sm3119]